MKPYEHLSKNDLIQILDIIDNNLNCYNETDFKKNVLKLQSVFSFENVFCVYGNPSTQFHVINIDYPDQFLERYMDKKYYQIDHVCNDFNSTFQIQNWKECSKKHKKGIGLIVNEEAGEFGLKDGFTYGVKNADGNASNISFCGSAIENTDRTKQIIELIIPHLSETIKKFSEPEIAKREYNLTHREIEILNWMKDGKTSWEISQILSISKRTVEFHVNNVVSKLDAMNRTHAVAIGLKHQLIGF